jgi:hypothetical protein
MAFLSYRTGLSCWIDGSAAPREDGAVVGSALTDQSGNDKHWGPFTGTPTFRHGVGPNGTSGWKLDGVSDCFTLSAALSTIFTSTAGTMLVVATPLAITANDASANLNHVLVGADGATDAFPCIMFKNVGGAAPTGYCVGKTAAGAQTYVSLGAQTVGRPGIYVYRKDASNIVANRQEAWSGATAAVATLAGTASNALIGRGSAVGGVYGYFEGYFFEALFFTAYVTNPNLHKVLAYLRAKYFSPSNAYPRDCYPAVTGDAFAQAQDIASRRVGGRRAPMEVAITVPYRKYGFLSCGDRVSIAHPAGYDPAGGGAGWPEASPRTVEVIATSADLDAQTLDLRLRDADLACRYYDSGIVDDIVQAQRKGEMVLAAAVERRGWRSTDGWYRDPASDLWTKIAGSAVGASRWGMALLNGRRNVLPRSSYISGSTGLTLAGGSGTCALDTTASIFDTTVQPTPQCVKITAGAPPTTGGSILWPNTEDLADASYWSTTVSSAAGTYLWLIVIWEESPATSAGLTFRLYRNKDAKYYDSGTNQFSAAAATYNPITQAASPLLPGSTTLRVFVKQIFNDAPVYTVNRLQLMLKLADGGTASRWVRSYHQELRGGRGAAVTQPYVHIGAAEGLIPTEASTVYIAPDHLLVRDASAAGTINATTGTFHFRYSARYLGNVLVASLVAPAGGTNFHRMHFFYALGVLFASAGPYLHLYWSPSGVGIEGTLTLDYVVGGVSYSVTLATTSTLFTAEHSFAFAWSATTLTLYMDGVAVGSVALPGAIAAMKTISWGWDAAAVAPNDYTQTVDGHVRDIGSYPRLWTAAEVLTWHNQG